MYLFNSFQNSLFLNNKWKKLQIAFACAVSNRLVLVPLKIILICFISYISKDVSTKMWSLSSKDN